MRIALLEDDVDQAKLMQVWLEESGYSCQHFINAKDFLKNIVLESYDLLVIDWLLPDMNGDEVVAWVRENKDWHIPVLFVTIRDTEEDIVHALERGADDFMIKPVKPRELMARINALIRRAIHLEHDQPMDVPPFSLDPLSRSITRDGQLIEMTHKEFDLAMFLFRNMGRILSRGHILESVWGRSPKVNTRTVDTHISRLRNKMGLNKEHGWKLNAIYQHGYRLERLEEDDIKQDSGIFH